VVKANPVTGLLTGLQQLVSTSIGLVGILLFTALGFLHAGVQNRNRIISAKVKERTRALNEANEKLAHLSSTDQLTGVDNRREMDRHLHQEWQRMAREKQPLSLMMIDVDMFKAFNDNYGHPAGDKCLVQIVQVLQGQLKRATDRLARYGGEEFVIILSNTGDEAAGLAEECRQAIETAYIDHAFSAVSDRITISIGLATIVPDLSYSSERLIAAADNAVYRAKQQGRNRVVIADKVEIEPDSIPVAEPGPETGSETGSESEPDSSTVP
jgi:diguanylate cyclase (GGDEF)-like protein